MNTITPPQTLKPLENILPEGAKPYDPADFNKDQKMRMILSAFSSGLQRIGKTCEDIMKANPDQKSGEFKVAQSILAMVDQTGQTGKTIVGPKHTGFNDEATGKAGRNFIPAKEVQKVLRDKYLTGKESGDDEVNGTIDVCLTELGFDITADEG